MTPYEEDILWALADGDMTRPTSMSYDAARSWWHAMMTLVRHGLAERVGAIGFRITDKGRQAAKSLIGPTLKSTRVSESKLKTSVKGSR